MSNRSLGLLLLVAGVIVALLFGLADIIGIGTDLTGFGVVQIIGLIVGVVLAVVGLIMLLSGGDSDTMPVSEPMSSPAAEPAARDDLTRIEGIGPALQEILYGAGITTFSKLAEAAAESLTSTVKAADFSAPFDASSWPRQAGLAAAGDWDALQKLQDELIGGREE